MGHSENKNLERIFQRLALCLLVLASLSGWSVHSFGEAGVTAPDSRRAGGATNEPSFESGVVSALSQHESTRYAAAATGGSRSDRRPGGSDKKTADEKVWRSEDLDLLAVGMGIGDVDGDGKNEIVVIDPTTVYVYRITPEHKLALVCDYSPDGLELKSVDVAQVRKQGNCRIYVSAQNRGSVTSLVLEYRAGALVPVATSVPYFLRILDYPTHGPFLLGQRKGLVKMYDGPILKMVDKGDDVEPQGRFGVPLKIPIFGFAIGDLEGKQKPLIAVYDREDHLRVYEPSGKRLFVSQDYYGGSDVLLKTGGPEVRKDAMRSAIEPDKEFFRPRILAKDLRKNSVYEILAISHASKTKRMLSHTKMLEEGRVVGLTWNGDALVESWATPKIQGMIADFAIESIPGFTGERLITLERKKTDWLAFLRSKSQIRVYDLHALMAEGTQKGSRED